ncbi:hypothetical protein RhiirA4_528312 [Rhizophagus irregularis]|uniref:Galactose oxidase n=1 Tax=Rhizophagus irregularis TaxID=588596 RepID=A0A2I1FZK9_9GLOM|nr:hypothetical protein RhiirA4_528312 [Rhizophagus irregularis]
MCADSKVFLIGRMHAADNSTVNHVSELLFTLLNLAGISLDTDELVKQSKWIDLTNIKPKPDNIGFRNPIPSGNKIMFLDDFAGNFYVNAFDTTLKKWEINQYVNIVQQPKLFIPFTNWISDEKTGKSYLTQTLLNEKVLIFDTINMVLNTSASVPKIFSEKYPSGGFLNSYDKYVQVLIPNGQILFIGGIINNINLPMDSLLVYDTINDIWQILNTTGKAPEARTDHTAVSTSDGRVIVFGGVSKQSTPALPHLSILNISKTPYEWLTPIVENPIGAFSGHTSVMVNNYMISAFGKNESNKDPLINSLNEDFYKLNVSDPLKYKWSLLAKYNYRDNSPKTTQTAFVGNNSFAPSETEVSAVANSSFNEDVSRTRLAVIIIFVIIILICILILFYFYKKKQNNKESSSNNETKNI